MVYFAPFLYNTQTGHKIPFAARLNGSTSRMVGTFAAGSSDWTLSFWCRRHKSGVWQILFSVWNGGSSSDATRLDLSFDAADTLSLIGGITVFRQSTVKFTDEGWYHVVVNSAFDVWVNGVAVAWSTNSGTIGTAVNTNLEHSFGARAYSATQFAPIDLAEVRFINGQELTATAFGEFNNNAWEPRAFAGTLGPLDRYYNFSNAANLGEDSSGNGLDMTVYDFEQIATTPTDVASALNPLDVSPKIATFFDGNREFAGQTYTSYYHPAVSNLAFDVEDADGFYARLKLVQNNGTATNWNGFGIVKADGNIATSPSTTLTLPDGVMLSDGGILRNHGVELSPGGYIPNATTGDYLNIFVKNGAIWFGKNGTWVGDPVAGTGAAVSGLTGLYKFWGCAYYSSTAGRQRWDFLDDTDMPTGGKLLTVANLTPNAITSGTTDQDNYVWTGGACTSVTWNGVTYDEATHDRSVIEFYGTGFIPLSGGTSVSWSSVVPNPIGGTVMPRGQSN